MSEVIISNNIEDYKKYIGITLRNKSGFPIANIVDVISYTNTWNVNKAVFVLDNGKKVFVNNTKMARRIRSVNTAMKVSRKVSVHDTVCNRTLDVSSPFAIGKSFYKDGEYVDTYIYECNAIAAVKKNQVKVAFIAFQKSHEGSSYLTYPMTSAMSGMGRKG